MPVVISLALENPQEYETDKWKEGSGNNERFHNHGSEGKLAKHANKSWLEKPNQHLHT